MIGFRIRGRFSFRLFQRDFEHSVDVFVPSSFQYTMSILETGICASRETFCDLLPSQTEFFNFLFQKLIILRPSWRLDDPRAETLRPSLLALARTTILHLGGLIVENIPSCCARLSISYFSQLTKGHVNDSNCGLWKTSEYD
jgi:hypothetical protein